VLLLKRFKLIKWEVNFPITLKIMEQQTPNNPYRKLQMFLLVGVIVVFPLISFIVNMKGAEKGRAFYGDIKNNLGKLPEFNLRSYTDPNAESANSKGKTRVVSFLSIESRDSVLSVMKAISRTEQLREEIDNLNFMTFDLTTDSLATAQYVRNISPNERQNWQLLRGGSDVASAIKLPNAFNFALIDSANIIRRFYDIRQEEERRKLIEHIAVMPIHKKKSIVKRDQKAM
jgi:hypothetical protein